MKRALIQLGIIFAISLLLGTIAAWASIITMLLLTYTRRGRNISLRIRHGFMVWKYTKLYPWFKRNKNHWFFRYLEGASWFKWYGRKVVYVKPKTKLTVTEQDLKAAINIKDYKKALDIVNQLPHNAKTIALKQVIEAKLK